MLTRKLPAVMSQWTDGGSKRRNIFLKRSIQEVPTKWYNLTILMMILIIKAGSRWGGVRANDWIVDWERNVAVMAAEDWVFKPRDGRFISYILILNWWKWSDYSRFQSILMPAEYWSRYIYLRDSEDQTTHIWEHHDWPGCYFIQCR